MSKPAAADLAQMTRWCRRHVAAHIDDCNEVDVTGLALACAAAHGAVALRRLAHRLGVVV